MPPLITEANNFADNVPTYADDVTEFIEENERLREINEDYDITAQLEKEAQEAPRIVSAEPRALRDVGLRDRELRVRPDHDPRALGVPARQRAHVDRRMDRLATT